MTHATRVLAQLKTAEETLGESADLRERIEELENADATHEDVPVNILKEWRGGSLLSVRYLDGERHGTVAYVDADEIGEWDPADAAHGV